MTEGDTDIPIKPEANRQPNGTFGPGNVANPNGRPRKGYAISDVIRDMMDEKPEIKRALGAKLIQLALGGDLQAINAVMDRLEGRPMVKAEVTNIEPPVPILGSFDVHNNNSAKEAEEAK